MKNKSILSILLVAIFLAPSFNLAYAESQPTFTVNSLPINQNITSGSDMVTLAKFQMTSTIHLMMDNFGLVFVQDGSDDMPLIHNVRLLIDGVPISQNIDYPILSYTSNNIRNENTINAYMVFEPGVSRTIEVLAGVYPLTSTHKLHTQIGSIGMNSSERVNLISTDQDPVSINPPICSPNSEQYITLVSPNGGESYKENQNVKVKWTSCNLSSDSLISINLNEYDSNNKRVSFRGVGSSLNTGEKIIPIGTLQNMKNSPDLNGVLPNPSDVIFGKHFSIEINASDSVSTTLTLPDQSDRLFSLTSGAFRYTRTMRIGMRGNDVKELQKILGIEPSGNFEKVTLQKAKEWQRKNGLKPDGVLGAASRAILNK